MTVLRSLTSHDFVRTRAVWKWLLSLTVFFIVFLAGVPSFATILVTQKNPGNEAVGAEITVVSDWTYSTLGVDVTGREWRTPALWSIGLTRRIQGHTLFLERATLQRQFSGMAEKPRPHVKHFV